LRDLVLEIRTVVAAAASPWVVTTQEQGFFDGGIKSPIFHWNRIHRIGTIQDFSRHILHRFGGISHFHTREDERGCYTRNGQVQRRIISTAKLRYH
jgi:hypothetical protein